MTRIWALLWRRIAIEQLKHTPVTTHETNAFFFCYLRFVWYINNLTWTLFWRLVLFKTLENVKFGAEYGLNQRLHCNFQTHTHLSSNVSQSRYDKRIYICHRYIHGQRVIYWLTWRQTLQYQWRQCWPKPIGMTSMFWPWRLWMTCCKMPTCCELLCLWCSWERITLCQSAVYARTSHW